MAHFSAWSLLNLQCFTTFLHRFTPEEKAKRHPCAYLPFGHGPRNCIGMRFALLEVKMALIAIVQKYKIALSPETKVGSWLVKVFNLWNSRFNILQAWQKAITGHLSSILSCKPFCGHFSEMSISLMSEVYVLTVVIEPFTEESIDDHISSCDIKPDTKSRPLNTHNQFTRPPVWKC